MANSASAAIYDLIKKMKGASVKTREAEINETKSKELMDTLRKMEAEYKSLDIKTFGQYNTDTVVTRYEPESGLSLGKKAASYARNQAEATAGKTLAGVEDGLAEIQEEKASASEKAVEKRREADENYENRVQTVEKAMLNRGIYDSSITKTQLEDAEAYREGLRAKISADYEYTIKVCEEKRVRLEQARSDALNEYNIVLASAYDEKLQELRQQQIAAGEKYILDIENAEKARTKQQKDYDIAYGKAVREGEYTGNLEKEMEARYQAAWESFSSMGRVTAEKYLSDMEQELKELLGVHYYRLRDAVKTINYGGHG